ncbi:MAG: Gfo/Idh/MocA family oxidoreductase [Tenericutes bacterium]|nr:Gfo/Idh/MocA family oxidoreductase [Mycoplasmatota bacterium]
MLKLGLIGMGKMGQLHFLNSLHLKNVEMVAVADKLKKNRKMAESYNVKTYDDYARLLSSEDLDAVIISLPNFLREDCISQAAERGVDLFVDKPLARSLAEAQRIDAKVRKENVRMMTGVNYRYYDSVQKLKSMLDEGRIGDVVYATADLVINGPLGHGRVPSPVPEWWLSKEQAGGGALLDLGYHLIDLLNWMFGDLKLEYCKLGHRFQLPVEDGAMVVLNSGKSNVNCCVNVGWFSKTIFPNFNFRVNLHGTVGYKSTDTFAPKSLHVHAVKAGAGNFLRRITGKPLKYLWYTYYYHSFYCILDLFCNALQNDTELPVSLNEELEVMKIIDDIYKHSERLV